MAPPYRPLLHIFIASLLTCMALVGIGEPVWATEEITSLIKDLKDKDPQARSEAARALGMMGSAARTALPPLLAALDDPHEDVRSYAVFALGRLGIASKEVTYALINMLKDEDVGVQFQAVIAVSNIAPENEYAVAPLMEALQDERLEASRTQIIVNLARVGPKANAAGEMLLQIFLDHDAPAKHRSTAAIALGWVDYKEAIQPLIDMLADRDTGIRNGIVRGLGHFGPRAKEAVGPLVQLMQEKSSASYFSDRLQHTQMRVYAAAALSRIDPQAAIKPLVQALEDSESHLRTQSALSLGEIGPDAHAAILPLTQALEDENERVRQYAAKALGQIGPQAQAAVVPLTELLSDPLQIVRQEAAEALKKIRAPENPE